MMQTLVGREGFAQRHDAVLRAPRRPGRDLRRLRPGHRRRQPGQRPGAHCCRSSSAGTRQAGTPRLQRARRATTRRRARYTLTLSSRRCQPTPGQPDKLPFVIPVALGLVGRDGRDLPLQLEDEPRGAGTERLLVLDERAQTSSPSSTSPRAGAVAAARLLGAGDPGRRPTPTPTADAAGHDTDPFNRWEAGQRLALRAPARRGAPTATRAPRSTPPSSTPCAACCATRRWTPPSRNWC